MLAQEVDETLRTLAEQGFIETLGERAVPTGPGTPFQALPVPDARTGALIDAGTGAAKLADFESTRRAAVPALIDLIGPAADALAIQIEQAGTLSQRLPVLQRAAQTVAAMRGRATAEAFARRFGIG